MLYHATSEARKAALPFIDDWDRHWLRHERVFVCIRDHKPALASKAVLEDLDYAESFDPRTCRLAEQSAVANQAGAKRNRVNFRRRQQ